MKNLLTIVYGINTEEDDEGYVLYKENTKPISFKNKDKANSYKEKLIDEFMKTKSYSHNYTIDDDYKVNGSILETYYTDIINKHDKCVYRVVVTIVDLSNMVM